MACTHYASRDPGSPTVCDGWAADSQEDCLALCTNSSLPDGCARPEGYRCEFAGWSDNPDFPPGESSQFRCFLLSPPHTHTHTSAGKVRQERRVYISILTVPELYRLVPSRQRLVRAGP